jgi:hypothetical protein
MIIRLLRRPLACIALLLAACDKPAESPTPPAAAVAPAPTDTISIALLKALDAVPPSPDRFGYLVDTLDRRTLIRWLQAAAYDSLEGALATRWRLTQSDIRNENQLYNAYEAFYQGSPVLQPVLRRWAEARPASAEARLAEAYFHYGRAVAGRGGQLARSTSELQFAMMRHEIRLGYAAVDSALMIAPQHLIGHFLRMNFLRLGGADPETGGRMLREALSAQPTSFLVRDAVMTLLEPRWGGSFEMMAAFAESGREHMASNPKLAVLEGRVALEQARLSSEHFANARALLDQAAVHGEDYFLALEYGDLYWRHGQDIKALEALERARAFIPQGRTLVMNRARALARVAVRAPEGELRSRAFDEAERAFIFVQEMRIPAQDPAPHLERLRAVRAACQGVGPPCIDLR